MKQKFPIALLLGAAATFAIAQTVVVISKDGKVTTFNAEEVKEITFETKTAPDSYEFTDVATDVFGKAATLTFTSDDAPTLVMDVYTGNANYLKSRTYEVGVKSEANEGYFIDSDAKWTYVEKEGDKIGVKSGTMTVSNEKNDYTIDFDFLLADDTEFKGSYKGELSAFGQYRSFESSECKQTEPNDAVPGEIYLKLNDANWKYAMTLDFYMEPGVVTLPSGTYNLSEEKTPPCYGPKSEVSFYSPINETVKVTGPITVAVNGKNTSITFTAVDEEGLVFDMKYDGEISYLDLPPVEDSVTYSALTADVFGKAATLTFAADNQPTVVMDVYTGNANYLKSRTYEVGVKSDANEGYFIDSDAKWTYVEKGGDKIGVKSGTMTVSNEKNDYTIDFDFLLADDTEFKGSYKGDLSAFGQYRSFESSECKQTEPNDAVPGEIYLKLNDANWKYAMTLDFYMEPGVATLPSGTYNLSEEKTPPCYGPKSEVSFYSPINETVKVTGPITVAVNGKNTSITFTAVDEEGLVFDMKYDGEISYLDLPPVEEGVTYSALAVDVFGKAATLTFTADNQPTVVMDVYTGNANYLKSRTYEVGVKSEANEGYFIDSDAKWTYVEKEGDKIGVKSGTMTVSNEKNDYTIDFDLLLADDTELKGSYKGDLSAFGQYRSFESSECKQTEPNDAVPGEIYLKLNDANWKYAMTLDFYMEPGVVTLPSGTYNLSEEKTPPCYGPKSEVSFYSPINEIVKVTGPITVTVNGKNTSIEFEAVDEEGLVFDMKYDGEITYLQPAE